MADKSQIQDVIESLAVHCRPPLMSIEQRLLWLRTWAEDLQEYPIEAVAQACRQWRQSEATKFPTPGQLMPLVKACLPSERTERAEVWREASPEEYRAMSIREKIREHQILGHNAFSKAGPMFRNTTGSGPITKASGTHLEPGDMPDSHAAWIAEGKRHNEEIRRLRQYLNGTPLAVAAQ
jgi:hypothetical protein